MLVDTHAPFPLLVPVILALHLRVLSPLCIVFMFQLLVYHTIILSAYRFFNFLICLLGVSFG